MQELPSSQAPIGWPAANGPGRDGSRVAYVASQFDRFPHARDCGLESKSLLNLLRQDLSRFILAVCQNHARFGGSKCAEPGEQIGLPCVGTEPAKRMDAPFHSNLLAMDANEFLPVDEAPAKRTVSLVADDQNMRIRFPQVRLEVMEDASGVTHARARHNETRAGLIVDLHGILRSQAHLEGLEVFAQWFLGNVLRHSFIEQFVMARVNIECLDGHRTVQE